MTNIVVSGTFDRLHAGHKKMLSKIILDYMHFDNHLLVEITPNNYVQKFKKHSSIVQNEKERLLNVETYLKDYLAPAHFTVVIANDEYGSAMYSDNLDITVVGKDTEAWATMINFYRVQGGLSPLKIIVTEDYIKDGEKISSTRIRETEMFKTRLGFI